jgi:hypothetical protein
VIDPALKEAIDRLRRLGNESPKGKRRNDYDADRNMWFAALIEYATTVAQRVTGDLEAEVAFINVIGAIRSLLKREPLWIEKHRRRDAATAPLTDSDIETAIASNATLAAAAVELGISERTLRNRRHRKR